MNRGRRWYISYPSDGTMRLFPVGMSEINVLDGRIIFADKSEDVLSDSLYSIGVLSAGGLYLYSDKEVKLQFDKLDWIHVRAGIPIFLNNISYNCFQLKFTNDSYCYFIIFIDKEVNIKHG